MNRKRLLGFIALILALVIFIPACSASTTSGSTTSNTTGATTTMSSTTIGTSSTSNVNPAGELPIVNEKIEIEFMQLISETVIDYETNEMTKKMEEWTNIHINWKMVSDFATTKPLLLASGDLPEVFAGGVITIEEQLTYGADGTFIDLKPLIEEYGFYIEDVFAYDKAVEQAITAPNGSIYSLPAYSKTYHTSAPYKAWIRRDWLEAVGMPSPTTTDEFYNLLVEFKTKDPNKNGEADEIPASGVGSVPLYSVVPFIMNAFITSDFTAGNWFVQPYTGAVEVAYITNEWKDGLKYLRKLFEEGLIDAESFTQDSDLRKQKVEMNLVGVTFGHAPSAIAVPDSEAFQLLDVIIPMKGPNGHQLATYSGGATAIGRFTITKACKNPEAAFRWADYAYNEENNLEYLFGDEGSDWNYAEPGEKGINGLQALWKYGPDFAQSNQNKSWYQTIISFRTAEWRLGELAASPDSYYLRSGMESRLYDETKKYEPYWTEDVVPSVLWISADNSKEVADLKTALADYVSQSTARFISGDLDIDNYWDTYLNEINNIGLDKYLELVQASIN